MRNNHYFLLAMLVMASSPCGAFAQALDAQHRHQAEQRDNNEGREDLEKHGDGEHGEDEHGHHAAEGVTEISPEMAHQVGIAVAEAGPGTINRTLTTYGKVVTPPGQESHVRARFPGQIKQVYAQIGDHVQAGDLLAEIESNDSLRTYEIQAPIDGVVTERHANTGEFAQDQNLFSIADSDPLWVELKVFPDQRLEVTPGQTVLLSASKVKQRGTLAYLVPSRDGKPYLIGRVEIDNTKGHWTPGLFVQGDIAVETVEVPLVVETRALQSHHGVTVVFVEENNHYHARPVKLGRSDGFYTEVLHGFESGDRYVVDNSYLIKADIEKGGAAHSH